MPNFGTLIALSGSTFRRTTRAACGKCLTTGTSHNPQLTTAANWGNLFGGAAPSASPASAPAAPAPAQPTPDLAQLPAPAKTRERSRRVSGRASCSASGLLQQRCQCLGVNRISSRGRRGCKFDPRVTGTRRLVAAVTGPAICRWDAPAANLSVRRRSCVTSRSGGRAGKNRADPPSDALGHFAHRMPVEILVRCKRAQFKHAGDLQRQFFGGLHIFLT